MKYLKYFENEEDFTSAYTGEEYAEPWVSYTKENMEVAYNKRKLWFRVYQYMCYACDAQDFYPKEEIELIENLPDYFGEEDPETGERKPLCDLTIYFTGGYVPFDPDDPETYIHKLHVSRGKIDFRGEGIGGDWFIDDQQCVEGAYRFRIPFNGDGHIHWMQGEAYDNCSD